MADFVFVRRSCSICVARTEDSANGLFETIDEISIIVGAEQPVSMHVCHECRGKLIEPLLTFGEKAVPKKTNKITRGEFPCPEPGCDRTFQSKQGLGRHRASIHPEGEVMGLPNGMTIERATKLVDKGICPLCEKQLTDRSGVGSHLRAVHHIAGGLKTLGIARVNAVA